MEHYLESVDLRLKYENGALNITTDALDLVEFIKCNLGDEKGPMLDIGAGIGTLTFLMYRHENFTEFHAVELQKEVFKILEENVKLNDIDIKLYNIDIKEFEYTNKFKYIISNPPFYKVNSGFMPKDEILKISKFEINLNLSDLLDTTYKLLEDEGYFFLILPIERDKELRSDKRYVVDNFKEIFRGKKTFVTYLLRKRKND
ncbi:methyltransferase [Streptobacillus felis]|uniref:Methyltransferase n=1 Tax=Streptobacillus felis TaxID=1384509 RepID=A0A7Z0PEC2_9FUSO|nr:methyltransferase [Streptobacillus felis]NYV27703.1 methyltransferase [Streptobacillus felis]